MKTPDLLNPRGEYQEIYDQAYRFSKDRLHPLLPRMDDEDWYPPHLLRELADAGYLGITAPPALGGAGLDVFASGMVSEAMCYWNLNANAIWGPHENLCLNNLLRNGNAEQQQRFIPRLCRAELVGALALTEPGAGSDALGGMATTARRDGDHYVLNGRKLFISNGPIADVILVYAKSAPELGAKGISAFIVEKGMPGFGVAQTLRKMGWRGCPTGELVFDDCRVPVANRVLDENHGVAVVMSGLDIERAFFAVGILGSAQRVLDLSIAYAAERRQFGRPIGDFQMIQSMLADMYTELEAARLLAYRALLACNEMERGGGGRGELHKLCAAALLKSGNLHAQCTEMAVQIHGGMGFMWETEVNRHYRSAKISEIGAGSREIRRLIIAGELLKNAVR